MNEIELKGWFIAAVILSVIIGFIVSSVGSYKRFGGSYMNVMFNSWGRIVITLAPFLLYIGISAVSSGWAKLFQSSEVAMGAFLILLMANHELGCALAVKRIYLAERYKVSIISMWALFWLCAALVSVVLIFQANQIPLVAVLWQFILLTVAILTYFGSASVVKLVEIGYTPRRKMPDKALDPTV